MKVRDFINDLLKIDILLGSVGDLYMFCFNGVDVVGHGASMSNEMICLMCVGLTACHQKTQC